MDPHLAKPAAALWVIGVKSSIPMPVRGITHCTLHPLADPKEMDLWHEYPAACIEYATLSTVAENFVATFCCLLQHKADFVIYWQTNTQFSCLRLFPCMHSQVFNCCIHFCFTPVVAAEYSKVDLPSLSSPRNCRLHHCTPRSVFVAFFSAKWRHVQQFCGMASFSEGNVY